MKLLTIEERCNMDNGVTMKESDIFTEAEAKFIKEALKSDDETITIDGLVFDLEKYSIARVLAEFDNGRILFERIFFEYDGSIMYYPRIIA